ncbi:hypothetical protein ACFU5B_03555 [Streptomyces murinus]|uniref:hypothetical protein n=1 Tax=Streptomyces murinus TaxID=33900 RepID=UPI003628BC99
MAAQAFAEPGHALARLRTALYRLLKLPEPLSPPPSSPMLPVPEPAASPVTSWQVITSVAEDGAEPTVTVRRFPAAVAGHDADRADSATAFTHLACADDERDRRVAESASVVVRRRPTTTVVAALRWIEGMLAELPGSLLAASAVHGGHCLVGLRDGRTVEVTTTGPALDPGLPAAVVYACLRAGIPLDDTPVTLWIGDLRDEDVTLRLRPA